MKRRALPLLASLLLAASAPAFAQESIPTARVVLPWNDFKVLYDKGMAPQEKPEAAPRDHAIKRATYTGRVEGESTVFNARVEVEVMKAKGWVTVPLLPTSVALKRARIGAKDAAIYLEHGWYWLVTNQKGAIPIDLEFAVSTWESSGENGFSFQLAKSAGTEVTLTVPNESDLDFKVAGAQQLSDVAKGADRVLQATLPATGNLAVTWQRAAPEPTAEVAEVARVYAEHQALIGVGEGVLQGTSIVNYSILHAGQDHFSVSVPRDVTILDVKGQGIRDWSVSDAGGTRTVDVELNFEAKGAWTLRLDYEQPLADDVEHLEVPQLTVNGAERVKGWVGVDARSNLEITAGDVAEARSVDVRELPAAVLGQTDWPVLLGFKYRKEGWRIPLEVRQHKDVDMLVTIIDQLAATTVMTPDGRRMTQVTWAMRNNRAQYLRLQLPEGATPWSTFVGGRAVNPAQDADGRLMIPLARSSAAGGELARFAVELVYVEDGAAPADTGRGRFAADLPIADVPATSVAWTVYVPHKAKVNKRSVDGSLRQVNYFTPVDVGGVAGAEAAAQVQRQAQMTYESEGTAAGVQPVRVALPVDGQAMFFEKLLVMDEALQVGFDYKGLK